MKPLGDVAGLVGVTRPGGGVFAGPEGGGPALGGGMETEGCPLLPAAP